MKLVQTFICSYVLPHNEVVRVQSAVGDHNPSESVYYLLTSVSFFSNKLASIDVSQI
jgi:hypothetical protein